MVIEIVSMSIKHKAMCLYKQHNLAGLSGETRSNLAYVIKNPFAYSHV